MSKPKIISVINHKGGVGKTSLVVNIGAGLARKGLKVLVIDLDVQCNLTHYLIGDLNSDEPNVCDALINEESFQPLIRQTSTDKLDIIPAGENLVELELSIASAVGREFILKSCLKKTESINNYDVVLIDNPPHIGLGTVNSLVASNYFLVPISCEYLPMVGLKYLYKTVEKIKDKLNPELTALGVALTMYDRRESITKSVESMIREELNDLVFNSVIRINTKAKAAPSEMKTIFQYENNKTGKGTEDYTTLADEILGRLDV